MIYRFRFSLEDGIPSDLAKVFIEVMAKFRRGGLISSGVLLWGR